MGFKGLTPKWKVVSMRPPKGTPLREARHMTYRSLKFVHGCGRGAFPWI